jgi:cytosine/adenosine deaminase-related metal-dependent hydrolase
MEVDRKTFLRMSLLTAASAAVPAKVAAAPRSGPVAPPARRTLIKNADILTMDPTLGELMATDVLIDQGKIAGIGKNLAAGDAEIVNATGMILMPGMVDGHRHMWQTLIAGALVKTSKRYGEYMEAVNMKMGPSFTADDVRFANYLGSLQAIDSGVTTVLDHAHITHTREKATAMVEGLKDADIAGFSAYQITTTPNYTTGAVPHTAAWNELFAGPDEWHLEHAAWVKKHYFSNESDPLQFAVALSHAEFGPRSAESVRDEVVKARRLGARLMTQHIHGLDGDWKMGLPKSYRVVADLGKAGLLGPDYHVSHGNGLTDDELKMMLDTGGKLCATAFGEFAYPFPSIHVRSRKRGIPTGIGIDVPVGVTTDYFNHMRGAFLAMFQTAEGKAFANTIESVDTIKYATIDGANALGLGDVTGSITQGKRADLVLLRTDRIGFGAMGNLADRILTFGNIEDIDSVWTRGRLRKHRGQMLGVDWAKLRDERNTRGERVARQAATITFTN